MEECHQEREIIDINPFKKELQEVLNKHCQENASNTPDFILAGFIVNVLQAFNVAVQQRENYYKRDPRPSVTKNSP